MIDALSSGEASIRSAALGAAVRLKLLRAGMVISFLEDPSPAVRRRAIELAPRLSELSDEDREALAGAIAAQLADDDECAEVGAFALGELGVTTDAVVAALGAQARSDDDRASRESAVAALGALGAGLPVVLAALGDVATVRRRAVIALANFEGDEVDQALDAALSDRDRQVRQAAEDLLG